MITSSNICLEVTCAINKHYADGKVKHTSLVHTAGAVFLKSRFFFCNAFFVRWNHGRFGFAGGACGIGKAQVTRQLQAGERAGNRGRDMTVAGGDYGSTGSRRKPRNAGQSAGGAGRLPLSPALLCHHSSNYPEDSTGGPRAYSRGNENRG